MHLASLNAVQRIGRRGLLAGLGALPLAHPSYGAPAPCLVADVLFVCPSGTVKSAIAREVLKRRARERGIAVHSWSRGLVIEDHVSPALAAKLQADGVNPRAEPASALTPADPGRAGIVIAFDEAAQAPGLEHARAWDIPGFLGDYEGAKAGVTPRIEALLDELQARACRRALAVAYRGSITRRRGFPPTLRRGKNTRWLVGSTATTWALSAMTASPTLTGFSAEVSNIETAPPSPAT